MKRTGTQSVPLRARYPFPMFGLAGLVGVAISAAAMILVVYVAITSTAADVELRRQSMWFLLPLVPAAYGAVFLVTAEARLYWIWRTGRLSPLMMVIFEAARCAPDGVRLSDLSNRLSYEAYQRGKSSPTFAALVQTANEVAWLGYLKIERRPTGAVLMVPVELRGSESMHRR